MSIRPLAIDLGTAAWGWAMPEASGQRFASWSPKDPNQLADAIAGFGLWLADTITTRKPTLVVFERPFFIPQAPMAGIGLYQALGHGKAICRLRELLVDEVPPTSWQKHAKPRGWVKIKGNDENDARAILAWWLDIRAPQLRTVPDEKAPGRDRGCRAAGGLR